MAISDRAYRAYAGPTTPEWSRFLVLPRYAFEAVFASKLFTAFFALCFVPSVVGTVLIYLHHNLAALTKFGITADELLPIDNRFFFWLLMITGMMLGFVLAVIVGPGLVSRDLLHDALPLYLSRPFSRTEYVTGKLSVLVLLLSVTSWIPLLLLWALQAWLDDGGWAGRNLRIVAALVVGGFLWVLALSLLTLALSAVFKRRILAQVGLVVCFFVASGFGNAINGTMHTTYGTMLSLSETTQSVWVALFGVPPPDGNRLMPPAAAWVGVLGVISLCLWVLSRKVRAHEVVS